MEYGLVARWLAAFLLAGLAGLPVAAALLRRLPDRGAGVAMPLSLTVVTVVVLWVGRLSFGLPTILVGVAVLAAVALVVARRSPAAPDWGLAGETALVFTVAFLFMVAVRAVDPAVHSLGGEKFLDFGLLKSLLRASRLPPEDMWFAGEPVAYYYGGHLVSAVLAKLTATPGRYAYNLALAGFYGMLVAAAYGVGGALADARGGGRRRGALAAAFFVGLASNLMTAGRLVLWAIPDAVAGPAAAFLAAATGGDASALTTSPGRFGYWGASRVIDGTINEFPLFSWLNGDLHAHMMSTPFLLLVVALLVAYFRAPASSLRYRRALVFGAVPAVGGLLAVVNTWSFPTVLGLTGLALLLAPADPATLLPARLRGLAPASLADGLGSLGGEGRSGTELRRVLAAGGLAVGAEALAVLWALPFFLGPASTRQIAVLPDRSPLGGLLLVHGAFLVLFAVYLAGRLDLADRDARRQVAILAVGGIAVTTALGAPAVGLFVPLVVVGWYVLRRPTAGRPAGEAAGRGEPGVADGAGRQGEAGRLRDAGFEVVLVVAGAGLALAVEFAYVEELAAPGRMNTVFKIYTQVWVLWAVAAGAIFAALVAEYVASPSPVRVVEGRGPDLRPVASVLAVALLVSTASYGALALGNHFTGNTGYYERYERTGDPTLDATAYLAEHHPEEAAAIAWFDGREGTPTVVTAVPAGYYWEPSEGKGASAVSSMTGLPAVLGWFHEIGYRDRAAYRGRLADVRTIYTGEPAAQAALLREYDVRYVYVGPAERAAYETVTVTDLDGVTLVERWGDVAIYEVDQGALPAG